ncbi:MAG: hypothetical protein EH225_01350 [Calditrichaeota bacterium]|nr:MAG: hypothetical protein EH225_01350 [Calditrichota bacterium]
MKLTAFVFIALFSVTLLYSQDVHPFSDKLVKQEKPELQDRELRSKPIHVLYSLILPGAGQWSMGYRNRAKFFMGTEFLLWVGYAGSHLYANIIQDNYQSFAALHAGVTTSGKDDQYWINIGSAENIYNFNEQSLRNRDLQSFYYQTGDNYWQWDNAENRRFYNNLRVKEHNWERRATFLVATFILNRVVSAIDVIRILGKEKKMRENRMSHMYLNYRTNDMGLGVFQLNLTWKW